MITPDFLRLMARYNAWQNASLYAAADGLDTAARQAPRGAFFGSVEATLNHLLWADRLWLSRFAGTPKPHQPGIAESTRETGSWAELKAARLAMDRMIADWAGSVTAADIAGNLRWFSGAVNREVEKPRALLFVHYFNHQTHHRGQVHAMLTAAGARPEATDLPFMPDDR
jgi:uncharacterized damage-inducible protein DinB